MHRADYSPVEQASRDDNMTSGHPGVMPQVNPLDSTGVGDEDENEDYAEHEIVKFVKKTFKKRTCKRFVPDPKISNESSLCACGYAAANHPKGQENTSASSWTVKDDTELSPTDAFGEAEFVISGQKICKYIRVNYETKAEDLMTLMNKHWKMELPNLLISVTGGAQNFTMQPRLRDVFRQGLVKAAESTSAWIITGGTNTGVMKHVGEALRDYTIKHGTKKQLVALGIATWGCIENRDDLIPDDVRTGESKESNGCWPASYKVTDSPDKKKESPLDPNHTHFILVDNGTQKQFGVEIELRARLESEISKRASDEKSVSIPVVLVVLEGGPNTLETVMKAIEQGTPAIIVAGSGRAADVLAFAYERYKELKLDSKVDPKEESRQSENFEEKEKGYWEEVTSETKKRFREHEIKKCVGYIRACIAKMNHLTVFRLDSGYSAKDIDITILQALLKVNKDKQLDQMRLALFWDRVDIAKDEIFTENVQFKDEELHDLMYSAIVNDRVNFVKLFLDKGLNLKDFLTRKCFLKLYNEQSTIDRCRQFQRKVKKRKPMTMEDIGSVIKKLSGELFETNYSSDPAKEQKRNSKRVSILLQGVNPIEPPVSDEPSRDLFIWSVLTQRKDMAMAFWYEGREDLALAVVAHLLLSNRLLSDPESDPELNQELSKQITFYEELGVGLLKECHSSDQRKSIQLLVREIPAFGRTTVLKMAVEADNKSLISLPACQNLLTEAWTAKLSDDNHYVKLLVSTFLPFLAPVLLKFRDKEGKPTERQNAPGSSTLTKRTSQANLINGQVSETTGGQSVSASNSAVTYFEKMGAFFQAPVIKFCYNCMTYFAFLLLFGIILLTDFYPHISVKECILIAWVVTLIFEEIRQIAMDDARDVKRKLYNYITDIWNIMDVITIVTFLAGMILRFIPVSTCGQCFFAARIILALNFMTFFFRILHMFSIHRELGPKLVMIGKMMIDLFYFMIILLVFIAAYGIASHVILYPNQPLNIALARDVLSGAWWNIFGELGIDEVDGEKCDNDTILSYSAEQCASLDEEEFSAYGCGDYKEYQCPSIDWLVPIILAIYVLITNVLMLNLLIAMFSNTFSNVQAQSNVVWKMQRYHLVREYESRPLLPPPLIVIAHVHHLIRYIIRRYNSTLCLKFPSKFRLTFKPQSAEEKELLNWENVNAEEYLRKRDSDDKEATDKNANDRLESILRKVEEIAEKMPLLEKRLEQLENKLTKS